jgi:hypothetical protein
MKKWCFSKIFSRLTRKSFSPDKKVFDASKAGPTPAGKLSHNHLKAQH